MKNCFLKKIPLYLSLSRLLVVPFFFLFVSNGEERWSFSGEILAAIFILASLTDWLDGKLARQFNVESSIGAYIDTISDKILVLSALAILVELDRISALILTIFLSRDILIGGIRSMAATKGLVIAARSFGKWKATFQMIAIPCLLISNSFPLSLLKWNVLIDFHRLGLFILWISVILSLISGAQYIWIYLSQSKK